MRTAAFTIAFLAALAACGESVPQKSLGDYYFSRPNLTNLTGTVMGFPPAYSVPRAEDVAWIREALCERAALASGAWHGAATHIVETPKFGYWPLSESNRFSRYTAALTWADGTLGTNIVVGWNVQTNVGAGVDAVAIGSSEINLASGLDFGSGFNGYLSPDDADWLQGSATLVERSPPSHTNIITTVTTNYPAGYFDDHGNYVRNVSNVVEVIRMQMTNGTESVHSNVWHVTPPRVTSETTTNITYGSIVDLLFTSGQVTPAPVGKAPGIKFIPRFEQVTNWYSALRLMTRLAEGPTSSTSGVRYVSASWRSGSVITQTNVSQGADIDIRLLSSTEPSGTGRWPASGNQDLVFDTRWSRTVATTGGVDRIVKATLYGLAEVYSVPYGEASTFGSYVKRLGQPQKLDATSGDRVRFSASVDILGFLGEAADAIGAAPPRFDGEDWYISYYASASFVLVVDLLPRTSLESWNQSGGNQ